MVHRQTVRLIAGVALIAVLGSANVARAAFVASGTNLPDTDTTSDNAKYKVNYSSGSVDYNSTDVIDGVATRTQHGTIKITDTWMNCNAHELTFMQTDEPTGGFGAGGGLRLQLELMITNQSGKPWSSFWIKTADEVPQNSTPVSENHQHHAHFHPDDPNDPNAPASDPAPPMVSGMTGFMNVNVPDNSTMAEVKGGLHQSGQTFNTKGFFLHERNLQKQENNLQRNFKLILMPHCVPEPSSFVLMMLGWVGVALRWRCFGNRAP